MPWRTPERVVWACSKHAAALKQEGVPLYEIVRTCGLGDDVPCGAAATHLAILGVRGDGLRLVSVCGRHAHALEHLMAAGSR
jgi:hypothetical protein